MMVVQKASALSSARVKLGRWCVGWPSMCVGQGLALVVVVDPLDGIMLFPDGIFVDPVSQFAWQVKERETTFAFIMAECTWCWWLVRKTYEGDFRFLFMALVSNEVLSVCRHL